MNLLELIYVIPDFVNLFLSGFIFMYIYCWIENKKYDLSIVVIWSLIISLLVKSFYSTIHLFIFKDVDIAIPIKIILYSITGVVLAFVFIFIKKSKLLSSFLYKISNKSINDDIFKDVIDYSEKTVMNIYIKSSDIYYSGEFLYREEKENSSWIALVHYIRCNKETCGVLSNPDKDNLHSFILINLKDVECVELFYGENSNVWKRFIEM